MTGQDLLDEFRRVMSDEALPHLWSNAEALEYINDAVNEACERSLLIEDSSTAEVCALATVAAQSTYTLHASVIKVKRVTYGGSMLPETSVEALDESDAFWESRSGAPKAFIRTGLTGFRIYPTPDSVCDLSLTVYRRPIESLTVDSDLSAEIHPVYQLRLMPWAYRCAFLKTDSETLNRDFAAVREAEFERSFGHRHDVNVQRKQRDRRPHLIRSAWW